MKTYDDEELKANFWSKVNIPENLFDECWLWEGGNRGPTKKGGLVYGCIGRRHKGCKLKMLFAHRVSWELHSQMEIPGGKIVCHKCDVPLCVNPYHLFLGDDSINMADAKDKNRLAVGDSNGNSKLSWMAVVNIREKHQIGESLSNIAREYGVSYTTISRVCGGLTWTRI